MRKIPVYIMEEHHEAFYYWNYFIEKGLIQPQGNYLLHIDHHDDMETGGYDWNFEIAWKSLEQIKEFTYEKLGIADFIIPAVYQGIFDTVHVVKNLVPKKIDETAKYVQCIEKRYLKNGDYIPFLHGEYKLKGSKEYKFYIHRENGLGEWDNDDRNVILDLDLDYFCWDDSLSTVSVKRLEITKEAYEEYKSNPYNPFRILPRKLLQAKEVEGRYYLEYQEFVIPPQKPDKERIEKRINRLLDWICESQMKIAVIDICRSRYSGYLNNEVFPWIEEKFLEELGKRVEIKIEKIGE